MKDSAKPVRKCHACLLNMGDRCWLYRCPRGQWRHDRRCPGLENEVLYEAYRQWKAHPVVMTLQDIRREAFRARPRTAVRRRPGTAGSERTR